MIGVTAPADEGQPYDFVSRFFCPGVGIDEDPVTGSSFADLAPYWCDRFDLESVVGFQASKRGGYMRAIQTLSSVRLLGQVWIYLRGELDPSLARIHNRVDEHPEAPKRKKRRARTVKQLPAIFEEQVAPSESSPPPTSHPAPPDDVPQAPRIILTGEG